MVFHSFHSNYSYRAVRSYIEGLHYCRLLFYLNARRMR